jgi:hypothetical protein
MGYVAFLITNPIPDSLLRTEPRTVLAVIIIKVSRLNVSSRITYTIGSHRFDATKTALH